MKKKLEKDKSKKDKATQIENYIKKKKGRLKERHIKKLCKINGGSAEGLDLSGTDLSNLNLIGMDLRGIIFGNTETAKYEDPTKILKITNLSGTWMERADLRKANFGRAYLKNASFYHSNLTEATFWNANAEEVNFKKTILLNTDFYGANLKGSNFADALLNGANIQNTILSNTNISFDSIGSHLLQENRKEFENYYQRWYVSEAVRKHHTQEEVKIRFLRARDIYCDLKNSFLNSGKYDDASKAYFKERQLEKKTYFPFLAHRYYGDNKHSKFNYFSIKSWLLFFKYAFKWIIDWFAELSCGYGEKPLRALFLSVFLVILFTFLYMAIGGINALDGSMSSIDYFNYSLASFSTIGFNEFQASTSIARTMTSIESIIGISMLALLMFSLGNRISRS